MEADILSNLQDFLVSKTIKVDLSSTCRLCFRDKGAEPVNIFTDQINYSLQVNQMFQTELTDLSQWPSTACRTCVAKLDDLVLFKETVLSTQLQIQEVIKSNIKTEEEPTNAAAYVETYWCPTPGVSHDKKECSTAQPEAIVEEEGKEEEESEEDEDYKLSGKEESGASACEDEDSISDTESNSDDESEEFEEEESKHKPLGGKKKYRTNPKMPQDKDKLKLEAHFKSMGLLTCNICMAETAYIGQLVKHVRECHENIKYVYCCGLIAKNVPDIYDHMGFHLDPEKYQCEHCQKTHTTRKSLLGHIKNMHEEKPVAPKKVAKRERFTDENLLKQFKKAAQKTTPEEALLVEEMRRRHLLVCSICNEEHENLFYVFVHMMEVHNTRGFITCCERRLANRTYAYDHMRAHLNPDAFKCEHCDQRFLTWIARRHHTVRHHTAVEDYKFKCQTCGKSFASRYPLIRHISSHLPDEQRPHRCTECGKGYPTAFHLNTHVSSTHNLQNNCVCDICGKGFTTNGLLLQHRRFHDEAIRDKYKSKYMAPTPCNLCGKVVIKNAMKKHLNSCPANGKRYVCSVCNKELKSQRSLSLHSKMHEPNWPPSKKSI